jgi:hypothetical protein
MISASHGHSDPLQGIQETIRHSQNHHGNVLSQVEMFNKFHSTSNLHHSFPEPSPIIGSTQAYLWGVPMGTRLTRDSLVKNYLCTTQWPLITQSYEAWWATPK